MIRVRWPAFERLVRRGARRRVRAVPALRREYKRHSSRHRRVARWMLAPLPILVAGALLTGPLMGAREVAGDFGLSVAWGISMLLWTGVALVRGATFSGSLQGGWRLVMLLLFPVGNRAVFGHLVWRFLFRSLVLFGGLFVAALYLEAWEQHSVGIGFWPHVLLVAALQTVVNAALSLVLARHVNASKLWWSGASLCAAGFVGGVGARWFAPLLAGASDWLAWFTPAGWAWMVGHAEMPFAWFAPVAVLVAVAGWTARQWHVVYRPPELETLLPAATTAEEFEAVSPSEMQHVREAMRSGGFLSGADWASQPWLERWVAGWLTAREKLLTEFLLGGGSPGWTRAWRRGLKIAMVGLCLVVVPGTVFTWIVFIGGVSAMLVAVPLLTDDFPALKPAWGFGRGAPAYALSPCGFGELSATILKTSTPRLLAWLPICVVYCAAVAWRLGISPASGAGFGARLMLLCLLGQPVIITLLFSSGTNDSRNVRASWLWIIFVFLGLIVMMLGASLALLLAPAGYATAAAGAFGVFVLAFVKLYAVWFNRGGFDLVPAPQEGGL